MRIQFMQWHFLDNSIKKFQPKYSYPVSTGFRILNNHLPEIVGYLKIALPDTNRMFLVATLTLLHSTNRLHIPANNRKKTPKHYCERLYRACLSSSLLVRAFCWRSVLWSTIKVKLISFSCLIPYEP